MNKPGVMEKSGCTFDVMRDDIEVAIDGGDDGWHYRYLDLSVAKELRDWLGDAITWLETKP